MPPLQSSTDGIKIEWPKALLVEGNDPRNFFEALIKYLECRDVQIHNFGGIGELPAFLRGFTGATGYSSVTSLGIVRDAEGDANGAWQSVRSALENAKMPVPKRVGQRSVGKPDVSVFILPGNNQPGMLETLLNQTFADAPINECIDTFFQCVEDISQKQIQRPDKARAHAYLATRPEPHVSVGVAAMKGFWNLDHSVFEPLRSFLTEL